MWIMALLFGFGAGGLCEYFRRERELRRQNTKVGAPSASHNKQSAPCLHVESLFVNKAGFDECRICGHVFRS